jgi:hypothetical protein
MTDLMNGLRVWLTSLVVAVVGPMLGAADTASRTTPASPAAATGRSPATSRAEEVVGQPQRAGSPEFGILIIIGAVGFVILVAWLLARVTDDSRSSGDTTI